MNNSDKLDRDLIFDDNIFLSTENSEYSYSDLENFIHFFADSIDYSSYNLDSPIAYLSSSTDEFVLCIAACWILGIPIIPLQPNITDKELAKIIDELLPSHVFCSETNYKRIVNDKAILLDSNFLETGLNYKTKTLGYNLATEHSNSKVFGYFLTSGTTGNSKIVPLKRRQLVSAAKASAKTFKPDVNHFWLLCLPLNHIGGISVILRSLIYGSAIFRMPSFNLDKISVYLSSDSRFQAASLVPTMLLRLMEDESFKTHDDFKAILLGGGPSTVSLVSKAINKQIPLILSYGMTETCAQIVTKPIIKPSSNQFNEVSVGVPFSPNKLELRNETGSLIKPSQSGSIWLKGPQVFDGYFNPKLNNTVFDDDGWFNTGDFGHFNEFGELIIESRREDIIITGGENVVPLEVELALLEHLLIKEAIVIGVKDEEWGQKVTAIITAANGKTEPTLDELQSFLKPNLPSFKIPKKLIVTDEFPKTDLGKIKRKQLLKRISKE